MSYGDYDPRGADQVWWDGVWDYIPFASTLTNLENALQKSRIDKHERISNIFKENAYTSKDEPTYYDEYLKEKSWIRIIGCMIPGLNIIWAFGCDIYDSFKSKIYPNEKQTSDESLGSTYSAPRGSKYQVVVPKEVNPESVMISENEITLKGFADKDNVTVGVFGGNITVTNKESNSKVTINKDIAKKFHSYEVNENGDVIVRFKELKKDRVSISPKFRVPDICITNLPSDLDLSSVKLEWPHLYEVFVTTNSGVQYTINLPLDTVDRFLRLESKKQDGRTLVLVKDENTKAIKLQRSDLVGEITLDVENFKNLTILDSGDIEVKTKNGIRYFPGVLADLKKQNLQYFQKIMFYPATYIKIVTGLEHTRVDRVIVEFRK